MEFVDMKIKISKYPTHRWYHNFLYEKFGYKNEPKVSVHIDNFDTWSMDHTLALIVLPMLKQLKSTKQGAPYVYPEDVPSELRPSKEEVLAYTESGDTDSKFFERWDWVIDQMIFAFESKHTDWEEQFRSGEIDMQWIEIGNDWSQMVKGPNDTYKVDWEGKKEYQERITKGFTLFGKYYENLWD